MKPPSLAKFYDQLQDHDWTFEYSDDHSVWRRGISELAAIKEVLKLGGEKYEKLFQAWSDYAWGRCKDKPKKPTTRKVKVQ